MAIEKWSPGSKEIIVTGKSMEEYYFMLALIVAVQHYYRREKTKGQKISYKGIIKLVSKEWGDKFTTKDYWKTHKPK